ncbi:DUF418 domain-containing protein [Nocardioides sp. L-11A]|uniref:DUF418 domain-containing protein n=1 Tax=Nocardioides sp. L-11A TaxID=3043848 RepID=UPI00249B5B29|nr:DUF418 domain-containing protein [Nocardioides sp. L-11A]
MASPTHCLPLVDGAVAARAAAPDLARGLALALIALANVMIYLHARAYGPRQHIVEENPLDLGVTALLVTWVDSRAYPLFAALFGYGMVRIADRVRSAGDERGAASALRRRSWWLIGFGAVHAALAFSGDVLGWYGLIGVVLASRTRLRGSALLWLAAAWLLVASAVQGAVYADPTVTDQRSFLWSFAIEDPGAALGWRLLEWLMTPFGLLSVVSAVLVGMWAAHRRVLERPCEYLILLRVTAFVGISAGVLGGIPMAVVTIQLWKPSSLVVGALSWLHILTGVLAGLGYLAAITLLARRWRDGRIARALRATGERSLSAYLAQTVVFGALLPAHTLGLGAVLGTTQAAALALLTWLATVVGAAMLAGSGRRGPAEALLRRCAR